ncbi:MAG: hypothetical protein RL424_1063, partial [Pseudomonadota bacterium]
RTSACILSLAMAGVSADTAGCLGEEDALEMT